jgi:NAD(P)-dependent dehydrogenase (short-subunit alcohol dehydrogenase family)
MSSASKVVIITGGGAGIGKACALRFSREGFRVLIGDRSSEAVYFMASEDAANITGQALMVDGGLSATAG